MEGYNFRKKKMGRKGLSKGNKRFRVSGDWSNLHSDLLRPIFNKLRVKEKRQFAKVCRSWQAVANDEILSFLKSYVSKSICLLFPDTSGQFDYNMYSVVDQKIRHFILPYYERYERKLFCSCSGGWTFLSEKDRDLKLWNPIWGYKIGLPYFPSVGSKNWIKKSIIFKLGVAMIYGDGNIGFVKYGDVEWSNLACGFAEDLTCSENSILVLSKNGESIQIWNFEEDSTDNILELKIEFPQNMLESAEPERYTHKLYIVELKGNIFLVVRWIAEFVHPDTGVHLTDDELIEEDNPLLVPYYATVNFYVYVLEGAGGDRDSNQTKREWIRVKSLGEKALFVGGNQSVMLEAAEDFGGCKKNSIYFTDDHWERMEEHECYGGHDMGIFFLEDSRCQDLSQAPKYLLPSFWII